VTSASVNMTVERAQTLPPVVDVPTAAAILGIGRTAAYELIRTGACRPQFCAWQTHPHSQWAPTRSGRSTPMIRTARVLPPRWTRLSATRPAVPRDRPADETHFG